MLLTLLIPQTTEASDIVELNKPISNRTSPDNDKLNTKKVSLTKNENKIRNAAVRVMTQSGYGSGTYITLFNKDVILTAAHVIHNQKVVMVMGADSDVYVGNVIYIDMISDIAILSVPKITSKTPVKFKQLKDKGDNLLGDNVSYSGFPGRHDLLTIRGEIAGFEGSYIILNSYGWPGASGSGVFNERGVYVGTLVMIDVGAFSGVSHLIEDIVWVIPSSQFNMDEIEESIRGLHN
jgi:V8-like Glu-specific endopeptidase